MTAWEDAIPAFLLPKMAERREENMKKAHKNAPHRGAFLSAAARN